MNFRIDFFLFELCSYVMGIGEAEEFSERLKRELQALEAANVHALLESEPLMDEVLPFSELMTFCWKFWFPLLCLNCSLFRLP